MEKLEAFIVVAQVMASVMDKAIAEKLIGYFLRLSRSLLDSELASHVARRSTSRAGC